MSILCVGQIVFDILVSPVSEQILQQDSTIVNSILFSNGGDALNVAMVCKKLGGLVGFLGKIGEDDKGAFLLDRMKSAGLKTDGVIVDSHVSTSSVIALIHENGSRNFLYEGGANDQFSVEDIHLDLVDSYNIVFVGGTFMLPRFDGQGAALLFKRAQEKGKITAMDVTYDASGQWLKTIEPCLSYLDYFIPSIGEAKEITGRDHVSRMADSLQGYGVKNVIIKMGKDGVFVREGDQDSIIPPYDVKVVDTTGAGDSFVAGFLTGIDLGFHLMDSVNLGQAVSAQCIQEMGSTTGIVDLQATKKMMKE